MFPGHVSGVLDCRATEINEAMKLAAAEAIASAVGDDELSETYIIPTVFNNKVVKKIREPLLKQLLRREWPEKYRRSNDT